ncbi:hypothetical protein K3369_20915 [Pseudomonas mandelii]|uniref:hypothetical protein n=1 Tax=Pseudomonas mandelii TaxID=75612 RepID=UPI001C82C0EE|nr:hypothetical protein [Pseudomonas mandelii]QZA96198.1 hypothetical protein K3369_20915 [Pseudomonas mandelii]
MASTEINTHLKTYSFSQNSFSATPTLYDYTNEEGFDWDALLNKVIDSAAAEFGSAIGKELAKRIFNSPTAWEKETSLKLDLVISKLDEILSAVAALRELVHQDILQSIREQVRSQIAAHIHSISDIMSDVRQHKRLTETSRDQLVIVTVLLKSGLDSLLDYRDEVTQKPLGLPLYAAAQTGVIMLTLGYRLMGSTLSGGIVERAVNKFTEWQQYANNIITPLIAEVNGEANNLNSFVKFAPMAISNDDEGNFHSNYQPGNEYLIMGRIAGSANEPFTIIDTPNGPMFDYRKWVESYTNLVLNVPQFPSPYNFVHRMPLWPYEIVHISARDDSFGRLFRMVEWLNARRSALLKKLAYIDDVQKLIRSLEAGKQRLGTLVTPP